MFSIHKCHHITLKTAIIEPFSTQINDRFLIAEDDRLKIH